MPLFVYNRNIPDGPNNPSVDQPDMETNTNSTDDLIDVDHFSFNDANGGLHRQVNFVNESSPTLLGDSVIYSTTNSPLARAVPFIKNSVFDGPMISGLGFGLGPSGYTSLLGGVIIQWGFVNAPVPPFFTNATFGNVNFPVTFPTVNGIVGVWTSLGWSSASMLPPENAASVSIDTTSLNTASFAWIFNGRNGSVTFNTGINRFYWVAIGY